MTRFSEMDEHEQRIATIDMAIHDAITNINFLRDLSRSEVVFHLDELDKLVQCCLYLTEHIVFENEADKNV